MTTQRASAAASVREALDFLWPGRFDEAIPLGDDEALGGEGVGLDSIEIVELVLECQSRVGLAADRADELLESGPLTVGGLIDHLAQA